MDILVSLPKMQRADSVGQTVDETGITRQLGKVMHIRLAAATKTIGHSDGRKGIQTDCAKEQRNSSTPALSHAALLQVSW